MRENVTRISRARAYLDYGQYLIGAKATNLHAEPESLLPHLVDGIGIAGVPADHVNARKIKRDRE